MKSRNRALAMAASRAPVQHTGVQYCLYRQVGHLHQKLSRREGEHLVGAARTLTVKHRPAGAADNQKVRHVEGSGRKLYDACLSAYLARHMGCAAVTILPGLHTETRARQPATKWRAHLRTEMIDCTIIAFRMPMNMTLLYCTPMMFKILQEQRSTGSLGGRVVSRFDQPADANALGKPLHAATCSPVVGVSVVTLQQGSAALPKGGEASRLR